MSRQVLHTVGEGDDGRGSRPLGAGMDSGVLALMTVPNGDLVVGGWFTTAGGTAANSIARWDGTSWSPLGSGMDGGVISLTTLRFGWHYLRQAGQPGRCHNDHNRH